ncbi:MAG TPA: response regulator transcription factor [Opitutus sp.]|nr:response regulator transcription factor [Opitutus sp.]
MKTILLVDDNPANLGVLIELLRNSGYQLRVAESGERALVQLRHTPVDIVLLDVMMPGIDGLETCRRLKADPAWADLPVIFMTALDDVVDKVAGFAAGAVDYIPKPLQPEEVLARVRTHLRLRELQTELEERNEQLDAAIRLRLSAEQALSDSLDRAVIVVDRHDGVVFCTKAASRLLARHFPGASVDRVPAGLRLAPANGIPLRVVPVLPSNGSDFQLLALEPTRPAPRAADLESLGLTPREAEVLFWIAQGKSNPEVAVILETSINTIKSHSQRIFEKLGVETRTAAALTAAKRLGQPLA